MIEKSLSQSLIKMEAVQPED